MLNLTEARKYVEENLDTVAEELGIIKPLRNVDLVLVEYMYSEMDKLTEYSVKKLDTKTLEWFEELAYDREVEVPDCVREELADRYDFEDFFED